MPTTVLMKERRTNLEWSGVDVFANAGVNNIATAVSGRPYTKAATPTERGRKWKLLAR